VLALSQTEDVQVDEGIEAEAERLFRAMDVDGSGSLDFQEYATLVHSLRQGLTTAAPRTADRTVPGGGRAARGIR